MNFERIIEINNEEETEQFGQELAQGCRPGDVIALIGDLGTGKTTLTKAIARGLGIEDRVTSPTFTIVQEYHDGRLPLYHFDVYRITNPEDMFEIGADEYFFGKGVCVVDWAAQILELMPQNTKYIFIEYDEEEKGRIYRCTF